MLKTMQMKADNDAQLLKLKNDESKMKAAQQLKMMAFKQQLEEEQLQQQTAAVELLSKAKVRLIPPLHTHKTPLPRLMRMLPSPRHKPKLELA